MMSCDAVQAPGKATITMPERALNDISTVAEAKVWNYGSSDMGIPVGNCDHSARNSQGCHDPGRARW